MFRLQVAVLILCLLASLSPATPAEDLGIRVPEGFEVSLYAGDALAHDIFSMTIDSHGRVVVAGAGYVKILHDRDGDGRADAATLFSDVPASGAHGMVFDGPDLVCTGDNSVMRLADANDDGIADGPPRIWTSLRHPEHGANGLVRGPEGCFYLVCGNDAGVSKSLITAAASPVRQPRSGAIVRFSADGKPLDVYAHGFRNPYDLDFDASGHLLTVDSDGERDHHLPWYAPTRLFDVAQGMEHGWLLQGWARGWNRPASYFDGVERLVEIGRGSPTGVAAYRHRAFPEHYRAGVFAACWTLGRVYYFPLEAIAASCRSQLEVFMQTTGDTGFAPCDLAIGPKGDLFVAIGGRHTLGSVFRVAWKGPREDRAVQPADLQPIDSVLRADQPLASWSRAKWTPLAKSLGREPFEQAAGDQRRDVASRVRAIEVLVDLFGGIDPALAETIARSADPLVRARVAWALGRGPFSPAAEQIVAGLTADADPAVERAAWEALATMDAIDPELPNQPDWSRGLASPVRRVRAGAIAVARGQGKASHARFRAKVRIASNAWPLRLAQIWIRLPESTDGSEPRVFDDNDLTTCVQSFVKSADNTNLRVEVVRLLQIGLGDLSIDKQGAEVYTGYHGRAAEQLTRATHDWMVGQLASRFPTGDAELNRELARLLGMLEADYPALLPAVARQWTADSSVEDDIHYLIVASLLSGPRTAETTTATAACLLGLHPKLDALGQFPSRNWPFRLGEAFDELCRRDPGLPAALVANPAFGHGEHTLFVAHLSDSERPATTRTLWALTVGKGREPSAELIGLAGRLPADEAAPLLRSQWEHAGLRDAIVLALSRHPRAADRSKFIEALGSPQPDVVARAAGALPWLGMDVTADELAASLAAFKQACALPRASEPRPSLIRLLEYWTEGSADVDDDPDPAKSYLGWYTMFDEYYPHEAAKLKNRAGIDAGSLRKRLASVDWPAGDVPRGREVFERRACHRCHQVSGHLGPELRGAVARMSRDDLFTAIVDPNLEVSPAFQTTAVATNSGQVYHGVVVYESPESTLLQTGPDTTVRILNADTASLRKSKQSLMPTGLLDTLSDRDLSDLYAYLRTLGAK